MTQIHIILTISQRELTRLRARFSGKARLAFLLVVALVLLVAALAMRESPGTGRGLYRVGLSPDAPPVRDSRLQTMQVDPAAGRALLAARDIDAYVDGAQVLSRADDKSRFAVNVLQRVLEKSELVRIDAQYPITRAFPLRVEINYLALPDASAPGATSASDTAVREQITAALNGGSPLKSSTDKEIIVPSLNTPPNPFAQVILGFVYILPVFMVSVFFTTGFMDEKTNRRLVVLLSAPLTPFQIIVGKMLPYVAFSLVGVVVIALLTQGDPLLALAIFTPAVLFIFGIYLIVPMLYRTFKDTTFISMLATAVTTAYLIFPAMFSGINELAYMSPVTLAVKMYRAESFGFKEYLFATLPLALIFGLALYVGTRVLNEEYLMGFRPLYRKLADALYLVMNREHPYLSVLCLSLVLIPLVYVVQLVALAISSNLPIRLAVGGMLVVAAGVEEVVKSAGIVVLHEHGLVRSTRQTLFLSFLSALGFLLGEKALLLFSLGAVSQSSLSEALFNSGLLPLPLAAHLVFTSIACVLVVRFKVPYPLAIIASTLVHSLYNYILVGGLV